MRVSRLVVACIGALALAGAPAALASGGGAGLGAAGTTVKHTVKHKASASGSRQRHHRSSTASVLSSGGAGVPLPTASTPVHPTVPGTVGKIIRGVAYAPANAPIQVQRAIWAGNKIRHMPYVYGGGHGSFNDTGYDCSGTVSYLLHAAGLLSTPMDSSEFMSWASAGLGHWMTVYTNPGHAFIEIAGIRMDTSSNGDPSGHSGSGPRWRRVLSDTSGYEARHPSSL